MIHTSIKKLRYVCALSHPLKKLSVKKKKKKKKKNCPLIHLLQHKFLNNTNLQIQL